jgi:hypothetical protein
MSSIHEQSTMVGAADEGSTNMASSEGSTYADKERDLEGSHIGEERKDGKLEDGDIEGVANESQGQSDDPTSTKDFPDLAPSKSMDFPDGQVLVDSD